MINSENKLYTTDKIKEKLILVGIEQGTKNTNNSLDELEELIKTAGAESVSKIIQKREHIHPAHYIGKGKIEELKFIINTYDATGIVCDDELSPNQIKNLEKLLNIKIMDRTIVILDIFASRASTNEGKIQVELAQLKYRLSRLSGIGVSMSKLGGGIGTRGPGETKLETDKRHIKQKIIELNKELKNIETHRQLLRNQREKKGMPVISLVGYTNAGKSTLMNTLTNSNLFAENKLFATLDTTTRKTKLPNGSNILLTDTVGFIQKLPHTLIKAFKTTLDELKYADILLHIVDSSNIELQEHINVVYKTLDELKCNDKPILTIFNKIDICNDSYPFLIDKKAQKTLKVSAKTGEGINDILIEIQEIIKSFKNPIKLLIPYNEGNIINYIHNKTEIIYEKHSENGYIIKAYANKEVENKLNLYKI